MLPTERDLAGRVAVSRTTVVSANGELKQAGRLESRQFPGTWVAGPPAAPPSSERPFSASSTAASSGRSRGSSSSPRPARPPRR